VETKDIEISLNNNGALIEKSVDWQLYQAIYNHITGKREILNQEINTSYSYTLDNILQLNMKIEQCLKQYNVKVINPSIDILHLKGRKEGFTSFEKLGIYNTSIIEPIKALKIQYKILLILPNIQSPQCYNIEIKIFSGLALYEEYKSEFPFRWLRRINKADSAEIKIEYVDYNVANSFMQLIEDWFKTNNMLETNKYLKKKKKRSEWITYFFKYSFPFISTSFLYLYVNKFISLTNNIESIRYSLISFVIISFFFILGKFIGNQIENSIDKIVSENIPRFEINIGDKELLNKHINKKKKSLRKAITKTILGIALGAVGSIVATYVLNTIS